MQKTLKWTPVQPMRRPDNIISSKARETGDIGFKPSYLSEGRENMDFIMSNEYMRLWFKERAKYETNTYSKEQIIKEESKIKRRFVQRMMTYRRPPKNAFVDEKCLLKTSIKDVNYVDYTKLKYKPVCGKQSKEKGGVPVPASARNNNNNNDRRNSKDSKSLARSERQEAVDNRGKSACQCSPAQ